MVSGTLAVTLSPGFSRLSDPSAFVPRENENEPLQALIFDSVYNPFRGVETYFRVINGSIKKNQEKHAE